MNRVQLSCDAFVVLGLSRRVIKWSLLIQLFVGCLFNSFYEFVAFCMFRPAPYRPRAKHGHTKTHKFTRNQLPDSTKKYSVGRESKVCHGMKTCNVSKPCQETQSMKATFKQSGNLANILKCLLHLDTVQVRLAQNAKLTGRSIVLLLYLWLL